jgi:hypothetical protein
VVSPVIEVQQGGGKSEREIAGVFTTLVFA